MRITIARPAFMMLGQPVRITIRRTDDGLSIREGEHKGSIFALEPHPRGYGRGELIGEPIELGATLSQPWFEISPQAQDGWRSMVHLESTDPPSKTAPTLRVFPEGARKIVAAKTVMTSPNTPAADLSLLPFCGLVLEAYNILQHRSPRIVGRPNAAEQHAKGVMAAFSALAEQVGVRTDTSDAARQLREIADQLDGRG